MTGSASSDQVTLAAEVLVVASHTELDDQLQRGLQSDGLESTICSARSLAQLTAETTRWAVLVTPDSVAVPPALCQQLRVITWSDSTESQSTPSSAFAHVGPAPHPDSLLRHIHRALAETLRQNVRQDTAGLNGTPSPVPVETPKPDRDAVREIMEQTPTPIYVINAELRITWHNAAASGNDRQVGRPLYDLASPTSRDDCRRHLSQAVEQALPSAFETVLQSADDERVLSEIRIRPWLPHAGQPRFLTTAEPRQWNQLPLSDARFQWLLEGTNSIVFQCDARTMLFTYVSPYAEQLLGYPIERWMNEPDFWEKHIHPEDREAVVATCKRETNMERDHHFEYRMIRADGQVVWIHDTVRLARDDQGEVRYLNGIMLDITSHKQATERQQHLSRILEDSVNEIFIFDADTLQFLEVNRGARRNLGYSMEELRRLTPLDLKPEYSQESFHELLRPLREHQQDQLEFDTVHRRKDGTLYPIEVHLQMSTWRGQPAIVAIILDVTQRSRALQALQESQALVQGIIDNSTAVIYAKDVEGRYILVNRLFETQFHLSNETIRGRTDFDVFPAEIARRFRENDLAVLRAGHPMQAEEIAPHDGEDHIYLSVKFPLFDSNGDACAVCGISTDITDRKKSQQELQLLESELAHISRVNTMGEMATVLAHEINQPLTAIASFTSLCQYQLADNEVPRSELLEHLERIAQQAQRAGRIVNRLKKFISRATPRLQSASINDVICEVAELMRAQLKEHNVQLNLTLEGNLPDVQMDVLQIQQVMVNLMQNAVDEMKEIPQELRRLSLSTEQGEQSVCVRVTDNGPGISPESRERLFEPYFTTKPTGLGVGLKISQRIIENHSSRLMAESGPDGGATFSFTLPFASPMTASGSD